MATPPSEKLRRQRILLLVSGLAGSTAFASTLRTSSASLVYVHYVGLLIFLAAVAWWTVIYFGRRWVWLIAIPMIAAVMSAWWYFDYSYSAWSEVDKGTTFSYQDWIKRGYAFPYYRRMTWTDSFGEEQYTVSRFTRYGKKHGLQTHSIKDPKHPNELIALGFEEDDKGLYRHRWFWYDEEISEGEWVLRNK